MDQFTRDSSDFAARFHLLLDGDAEQGPVVPHITLDTALRWWNLGWVTQSATMPWRWRPTQEGLVVLQASLGRAGALMR